MSALERKRATGLREQHKAEKLERLEAAARKLFSQKGFDGASTREIAREAGVAAGTLFVYFPEKKDLLLHVFLKDLEPVVEGAFAAVEGRSGPVAQLMYVFSRFFDHYENDRRLARVCIQELHWLEGARKERLSGFNMRFMARLMGLMTSARARGEVGDHFDLDLAPVIAFSLYLTALTVWLSDAAPRAVVEERLRAALELSLRGMAP